MCSAAEIIMLMRTVCYVLSMPPEKPLVAIKLPRFELEEHCRDDYQDVIRFCRNDTRRARPERINNSATHLRR